MSPAGKLEALKGLGAQRRASIVPEGCRPLADFHGGYYETDFVSPWTISACNVNAKLAIVLQDWCGSEYLSQAPRPEVRAIGHDPNLPTNRNLISLLQETSVSIDKTFGTNAFPWIKTGQMNARLEAHSLKYAVETFVLPQLSVIGPEVVVLLGKTVRNAVADVLGKPRAGTLVQAIENDLQFDDAVLVTVAHTGSKIHIHRGWDNAVNDWRRIGSMLA